MFSPCTPYLAGKLDGMARRRKRCPMRRAARQLPTTRLAISAA